jgi:hypothetical protein
VRALSLLDRLGEGMMHIEAPDGAVVRIRALYGQFSG